MGEEIQVVEDAPAAHLAPAGEPAVRSTSRSPRRTLAIIVYTLALACGTVALLMHGPLADAGAIKTDIPPAAMALLIGLVYAASFWVPVSFHHRGNTVQFSLEEVPLLLGLVFLAPDVLVVVCVTAIFVVFSLRRLALLKLAFNVAMAGFATSVAALVYRSALDSHLPVSPQGWGAATAALVAMLLTGNVLLVVIAKLYGQTREGRTGSQILTTMMLSAASIALAIVVLNAAWISLWAVVPVLLVAAMIIAAYRAYLRLSLRFSSLERLYDFSRVLGTTNLEPNSMSIEVLHQVCTVMRARQAQLVLAEPSGIPRRLTLTEDGPSGVQPIHLDDSSFVTQAIDQQTASLHVETPTPERSRPGTDPVVGEYTAALVAPLVNDNVSIGAIVAVDRDEAQDAFDEDDLRLFETLVAHASANLDRARLVEELRYEVDSKTHQATHDMLTGLPNRSLFVTRATAALAQAGRIAVVLLDLDRFKDVNDTLGHAIGDRLLCEVAERLQRTLPEDATVARLGGDEFALVIPNVTSWQQAAKKVEELRTALGRPIEIDGLTLATQGTAGVVLAPEHGDNVALLLQRADIAMYLAKDRHSGIEFYSVEHDQSMQRQLMLSGLLTHALETKSELSVMYHAIGDVRTGKIVQVEALTRWNHPELGSIPPDEFIGIAEQMGLVSQITDFVLARSCADLAAWRAEGIDVAVAINTSGREFSDGGLVERVRRQLAAHDLPADVLTLEVTETEVMADLLQASRVLDELAALGIRIAMDDYGTGYSSLEYIHRLPLQELKIDRSFVTNLPNEKSNRVIVDTSIHMAHSLGLSVVAEGAEDELTCAILAELGCDQIQGYYLSKPMKPDDLVAWLKAGAALRFDPLLARPSDELPLLLA
jgi:diguanylate cyclase (GGDEF)-like protein